MKANTIKSLSMLFLLVGMVFGFNACVNQDFDEPPAQGVTTDLVANTTIAQVKALHNGTSITEITDDLIIEGVVTADDEDGNFYKKIIIEDASAGIELSLNFTDIYNDYPEGRQVFIKCQGLLLDKYNEVVSIGGSTYIDDNGNTRLSGIDVTVVENFVFGGLYNQTIPNTVKTINSLDVTTDLSRLITIEELQFEDNQIGLVYAEDQVNTNRYLTDCNGNSIILRTSGYSDFIGNDVLTPSGNGAITAVLGYFGGNYQLVIRNLNDVNLTDTRCTVGSGGNTGGTTSPNSTGTPPTVNATISDVKAQYDGMNITEITSNLVVEAIVTADDASGNFYKKIVVEDATGGIDFSLNFFDLVDNYPVGRRLYINCQGLYIDRFNDVYSLGGGTFLDNNNNTRLGGVEEANADNVIFRSDVGQTVPNTTMDISMIGTGDMSKLVTLNNVEFVSADAGQSYADAVNQQSLNRTITDCNGNTIILRSSGYADFAANSTPNGNGSITGVLGAFGGAYQIYIREESDVNMNATRCTSGGGGNNSGCDVSEDFSGLAGNGGSQVSLSGWISHVADGNDPWEVAEFGSEVLVKCSGYEGNGPNIESWLITPSVDISSQKTLTFNTIIGYPQAGHEPLEVYVSQNFDGSDVAGATWNPLSAVIATASDVPSGDNWSGKIASGDITLPIGTTAHIAFVYTGDTSVDTSTMEVDDVNICE